MTETFTMLWIVHESLDKIQSNKIIVDLGDHCTFYPLDECLNVHSQPQSQSQSAMLVNISWDWHHTTCSPKYVHMCILMLLILTIDLSYNLSQLPITTKQGFGVAVEMIGELSLESLSSLPSPSWSLSESDDSSSNSFSTSSSSALLPCKYPR